MSDPSIHNRFSSWQQLATHSEQLKKCTLLELFTDNPQRAKTFSLEAAGLCLDFSKNLINEKTIQLFSNLFQEADIPTAIQQLFSGEHINNTEHRAAWHTNLRSADKTEEVAKVLQQVEHLVDRIHRGNWKSYNGKTITDIVNIGIGGSDLGPRMVCSALAPYKQKNIRVHFAANIDPTDLESTLNTINAENTLFIVASKTFTTLETLCNANKAKAWFIDQTGQTDISQHFIAISTALAKAQAFGINRQNIFPIWDWVGGRYSLWSAIGLPIAISLGWKNFVSLLEGAEKMDSHFSSQSGENNMPFLLALIGLYYQQFFNAETHALLPYDHCLRLFPNYLQQLDMESNGKRVNRQGEAVTYSTGPIIWGTEGTNGQHSFHQLLHQGSHCIPCDFILPLCTHSADREQHRHLVANCLAQSQALTAGKTLQQVENELRTDGLTEKEVAQLAPHKVVPGNRPHNIISFAKLTPETLGALIALYEHKIFIQGHILNINSFDQWGVELGKALSKPLFDALSASDKPDSTVFDSTTCKLICHYQKANKLTK